MTVVSLAVLTLRQIFRLRCKLTVSCRYCKYERVYSGWYIAKLMQELGEDTSIHGLSERSVCSQCGCKRMQFAA